MPDSSRFASPRLVLTTLFAANVLLACGPWLVRLSTSQALIGPVAAGFWRLTFALPFLLVATARFEGRLPRRPATIAVIGFAGLAFAADLGFWHVGLLHTRLSNAGLLGNITAIVFPIYGFVAARRWPARRQAIALLLAVIGTGFLLGRSYELSMRNLGGDIACLVAGLFYALYLIVLDRRRGHTGPYATLAIACAAGMPALLGFALALGEPVWPHAWAPLVLMALSSQVVGQGLILFAVSRVSPLVVGLMLLVQPMVTTAIGWLAYGERLAMGDLIGAAAIAAGMLLVRETAKDPSETLPDGRKALGSAS